MSSDWIDLGDDKKKPLPIQPQSKGPNDVSSTPARDGSSSSATNSRDDDVEAADALSPLNADPTALVADDNSTAMDAFHATNNNATPSSLFMAAAREMESGAMEENVVMRNIAKNIYTDAAEGVGQGEPAQERQLQPDEEVTRRHDGHQTQNRAAESQQESSVDANEPHHETGGNLTSDAPASPEPTKGTGGDKEEEAIAPPSAVSSEHTTNTNDSCGPSQKIPEVASAAGSAEAAAASLISQVVVAAAIRTASAAKLKTITAVKEGTRNTPPPQSAPSSPLVIRQHVWRPWLMALYRWQNPRQSAIATFLLAVVGCKVVLPYLMSLQHLSSLAALFLSGGLVVRALENRYPSMLSSFTMRVEAVGGTGKSAANTKNNTAHHQPRLAHACHSAVLRIAERANITEVFPAAVGHAWQLLLDADDPTRATTDDGPNGLSGTFLREAQEAGTLAEEVEAQDRQSLVRKILLIFLALIIIVQPLLEWATNVPVSLRSKRAPTPPVAEFAFLCSMFIMTRYPARMLIRKAYHEQVLPAVEKRRQKAAPTSTKASPATSSLKQNTPSHSPPAASGSPSDTTDGEAAGSSTLVKTISRRFSQFVLTSDLSDISDDDVASGDEAASVEEKHQPLFTLRWVVGDAIVLLLLALYVCVRRRLHAAS